MKKLLIITGCIVMTAWLSSCGPRRSEGRSYMPDMTYSRAYETYAPAQERLDAEGKDHELAARYTHLPVAGTIARGDMLPYQLKNDSAGYTASQFVTNPLDVASIDMKEAERLYLINCAICHGAKLDGNGPLYNSGKGPFTAAPRDFTADDMKKMPEGTMFHSVTYGIRLMGSYASQLTPQQRWMVIAYIKDKQNGGTAKQPAAADSSAAATDSTATAMK